MAARLRRQLYEMCNWSYLLIGVIAKNSEEKIIKEFFELFKTPWELYQNGCSYNIIITTGEQA